MDTKLLDTDVERFISENESENVEFSDLLNKNIYKIYQVKEDYIVILTNEGYVYILLHYVKMTKCNCL